MGVMPMPSKEEIGDNEVLVQILSEPDGLGRQRFVAFWAKDYLTPNGVAGQVFDARLDDFTARNDRRRLKTREWLPAPENGAFTSDRLGGK